MRLLNELDVTSCESITELSPMCPAFWRYRKKITIEFMSFKFQEYSQACDEADRCKVLAEFLRKVRKQMTSRNCLEYQGKEYLLTVSCLVWRKRKNRIMKNSLVRILSFQIVIIKLTKMRRYFKHVTRTTMFLTNSICQPRQAQY